MNKVEIIDRIYGAEPPFVYDTSLPQQVLDGIATEAVCHYSPGPEKDAARNRVYEIIRMGTVFAYDRRGDQSGLLPLTSEARAIILLSEYARLLYVPVWEGEV